MKSFKAKSTKAEIANPIKGKIFMNPKKPWFFFSSSLKRGKYLSVALPIPRGTNIATSKEKEYRIRVSPSSSFVRKCG